MWLTASILPLALCLIGLVHGWSVAPQGGLSVRPATKLDMVSSITLESLPDDHEKVGSELAGSLQRMLDIEWMPQEVHQTVAEQVKTTYIECRDAGQDDLMEIMTATADKLTENWKDYDEDMFVGAWDVSNYVSDWLTAKSGVDGCDCSAKIF